MSYKADDEEISVFQYNADEAVVDEGVVSYEELKEEAVSAQRLTVGRLAGKYLKGRMEITHGDSRSKVTPEKKFNLTRLIQWDSGDPDEVVELLVAGRVRARVNAAMGVGKSIKLGTQIVSRVGHRVLHVAIDAVALHQVAVRVAEIGIGRYRKHWSSRKEPRLCCMTYADYNGHMSSARRNEFQGCFDTVIFDEGFAGLADIFTAKRLFSVYAPADQNLLVCSATISTDNAVMASAGMGTFKQVSGVVSIDDAVDQGKLVDQYLVDRTVTLTPSDAEIDRLEAHYLENGVDVRVLHSAAASVDVDRTSEWLRGDSTTSRVVVAHMRFCIAFNFPLEFVILSPYREAFHMEGDVAEYKQLPLSEPMVAQAKARTGRGIAKESGGLVLSEERGPTLELEESEKFEAFVKLSAARVTPMRTSFWEKCYELFPDGLDAGVAATILKINLPVQIAVRYLCKDGKVASKFYRALNFFSQPDHFHLPSEHEFPETYDSWPLDDFKVGMSEVAPVKVPCLAVGELQVIVHSIAAMADGKFSLERWRPRVATAHGDGFLSDDEGVDVRAVARSTRLRRVVDVETASVMSPVVPEPAWSYRPRVHGVDTRRTGGIMDKERMVEALRQLEESLYEYKVPEPKPEAVVETEEGTVAQVTVGVGAIESPGGSLVCTMPLSIYEKANMGKVLSADEFIQFIEAYRIDRSRFVQSRMFDAFSGHGNVS